MLTRNQKCKGRKLLLFFLALFLDAMVSSPSLVSTNFFDQQSKARKGLLGKGEFHPLINPNGETRLVALPEHSPEVRVRAGISNLADIDGIGLPLLESSTLKKPLLGQKPHQASCQVSWPLRC